MNEKKDRPHSFHLKLDADLLKAIDSRGRKQRLSMTGVITQALLKDLEPELERIGT